MYPQFYYRNIRRSPDFENFVNYPIRLSFVHRCVCFCLHVAGLRLVVPQKPSQKNCEMIWLIASLPRMLHNFMDCLHLTKNSSISTKRHRFIFERLSPMHSVLSAKAERPGHKPTGLLLISPTRRPGRSATVTPSLAIPLRSRFVRQATAARCFRGCLKAIDLGFRTGPGPRKRRIALNSEIGVESFTSKVEMIMTIRLNYIEGPRVKSEANPLRPPGKNRTEEFADENAALAKAREIIADGRFHTISMNDGEKLITEPRLRKRLDMAAR